MHLVHHSTLPIETNSNFGFNLSIWDRLFGTYRREPREGREKMKLGLEFLRDTKYLALCRSFSKSLFSIAGDVSPGAIGRRKSKAYRMTPGNRDGEYEV